MKSSRLLSALVAACISLPAIALAQQVGDEVPTDLVISRGNLEWVWASALAGQDSFDTPVFHHGFALPTEQQWLSSFQNAADLKSAFEPSPGNQLCAAAYFIQNSAYAHCDSVDLDTGAIWHAPSPIGLVYPNDPGAETFLVRQVPEPGAVMMLVAGMAVFYGLSKRKALIQHLPPA
jgi:hypothetical protein